MKEDAQEEVGGGKETTGDSWENDPQNPWRIEERDTWEWVKSYERDPAALAVFWEIYRILMNKDREWKWNECCRNCMGEIRREIRDYLRKEKPRR